VEGELEAGELEARRIVRRRFGAYSTSLALLTSLGLLTLAGVRGVASWGWLAFAVLLGVVGAAWTVRAVLAARPRSVEPPRGDRYGVFPATASAVAESPSAGDDSSLDRVDYLTALRHEFRTPLNAVLGFSDVLLSGIDGEVNASQREDLEIIRGSGIRLRVLLDGALDLSQLADGELRLDTERMDVRELVSRVVDEAGQLWSSKRSADAVLPEAPCLVDVDEARLRRSLLVLADFLATEHRKAVVALRVTPSNDHLAIEVTAEPSAGMSLDVLPTPAEVLASEDANEIRRWPIAVTSEVIARHDGTLYRGDGPCRFMIRLPVGGGR
jgi:signal transduction histidine kinase